MYLLQSYLEDTFDTHDQRLFSYCMDRAGLEYLGLRARVAEPLHPKSHEEVLPCFVLMSYLHILVWCRVWI